MAHSRFINVPPPSSSTNSNLNFNFNLNLNQSNSSGIQVQRSHTFPFGSGPPAGATSSPPTRSSYPKLMVEPKPPGPPPFPQQQEDGDNNSINFGGNNGRNGPSLNFNSLLSVSRCSSAPIHSQNMHKKDNMEIKDFACEMSKTLSYKSDRLELAPPRPTTTNRSSLGVSPLRPIDLPPLEPAFKPTKSDNPPYQSPF